MRVQPPHARVQDRTPPLDPSRPEFSNQEIIVLAASHLYRTIGALAASILEPHRMTSSRLARIVLSMLAGSR